MGNLQQAPSACRFCGIAKGRGTKNTDNLIAESPSYFAIPSLGSLIPGWVLICPKEHHVNMAGEYADTELTAFRVRIGRALSERFNLPVKMFEHGATALGSATGCGVDHAHVHLVATDIDILEYKSGLESHEWRTVVSSQVQNVVGGLEYLFHAEHATVDDPIGKLALPTLPTSQYFRRALAFAINRPAEYDYRVHPHTGNAIKTAQALRHIA